MCACSGILPRVPLTDLCDCHRVVLLPLGSELRAALANVPCGGGGDAACQQAQQLELHDLVLGEVWCGEDDGSVRCSCGSMWDTEITTSVSCFLLSTGMGYTV